MNTKGHCKKCGQVIQQTTFNKCLYCGAVLPEEQQFSEQEKHQIKDRQRKTEVELKEQHAKSMKDAKKTAGGYDTFGLGSVDDYSGGGDC